MDEVAGCNFVLREATWLERVGAMSRRESEEFLIGTLPDHFAGAQLNLKDSTLATGPLGHLEPALPSTIAECEVDTDAIPFLLTTE